MKKLYLILIVLILIITGCSNNNNNSNVETTPETSVEVNTSNSQEASSVDTVENEDVIISSGDYNNSEINIGSLEDNNIAIKLPDSATDESLAVVIKSGSSIDHEDATPLSEPIDIFANDGHTRFDEAVTVDFKVDPELLVDDETLSEIRVGYYDGDSWHYIQPTSVKSTSGIVTFETYHFSPYQVTKLEEEGLIKEWVTNQAVKKFGDTKDKYVNELAQQSIDLVLSKLNIKDSSVAGKVIDSIRKDSEWKEMIDKYEKNDMAGLNQSLQLLIGKKIAENVGSSSLKSALEGISSETGVAWVAKGSEALGYMAEGQYKEAARIIGEKMSEDLIIVKASKFAIDMIDGQIESWKKSEIEGAYKAYRDGADNYFFGYNVDPGKFDDVWNQMRGIGTRLQSEAIKLANKNRLEIGFPELNDAEMDAVRLKVKEDYREKFKARLENEKKIEAEKQQLKLLVDEFVARGFIGKKSKLHSLSDKFSMEQQLDIVKNFADKFMADTNATNLVEKIGVRHDKNISVDYISFAARIYFNEGKEAYNEYLKEEFGISIHAKIAELSGTWTLNFEVIETNIPASEEDSDIGCEVGDQFAQTGQMTIINETKVMFKNSDMDEGLYFSYIDGVLALIITDQITEDPTLSSCNMTMTQDKDKKGLAFKGKLSVGYTDGTSVLFNIGLER